MRRTHLVWPGRSTLHALARGMAFALAALLVAGASLAATATPAWAAGTVTVEGEADPNGQSELRLQGTGFQSVPGGFGGIYVLFGWVDDPNGMSWSPSNGGVTGGNYRYVYDDETNPAGFQLFVTFPGSSTAAAANGGEVAADGTWSASIKVPGAAFTTYDRQLNETAVDCTQVTCGIITIGAHGVKNANNESFTPVTWAGSAAPAASESSETSSEPDAGQVVPPAQAATTPAPAETEAPATPTTEASGDLDMSEFGWLLVMMPAAFLLGLGVLVLAGGIGAYLAMKSLLLGVNPAALEKVRGQRERAGLKERERQERKTKRRERKLAMKAARQYRRESALVARVAMRQERRDPRALETEPQATERWLGFFEGDDEARPAAADDARTQKLEFTDSRPRTGREG